MADPTDALTDEPQAAAEAQRAAEFKRQQQVDDLKWLMAHAQGRRIATRILERTGYRRTPFNTNGSTMAFNAGQQNVGLWFEAELVDASPDAYLKLLKDFRNE